MFRKKNPLIKFFLSNNIINKEDLILLKEKTRNHNSKVHRCAKTGIFLNEYVINHPETYFKLSYWKKNKIINKYKNLTSLTYSKENKKRTNELKKYFINKSLLDFGCYDASFCKLASRHAKTTFGYDVAIKKTKLRKVILTDDLNDIKNNLDCITIFQTFHYLTDPILVLKKLKCKLKNKGVIILEVPHANNILYNFDFFRKFSFSIEAPILHTPESLFFLIKKAGFSNVKIEFYQRYNFANFNGWLLDKKPGGHLNKKYYHLNKWDNIFKKNLLNNKQTDSLRAYIKI